MLIPRTLSGLIAGILMVPVCCCAFGAFAFEEPVAEHGCCGFPDSQPNPSDSGDAACSEGCASKDLTDWVPQDRPEPAPSLSYLLQASFSLSTPAVADELLTFRQGYWKPPPPAALRTLHCSWLI